MAVAIQTTSYPIFTEIKIVLGFGGGSKSVSKSLNVTWNISKTTVTGARLIVRASADWGVCDFIIHFNAEEVYRKDWVAREEAQAGILERIDVSTLLQNGVNTITVTGEKPLGGVTFTVSVALEVDFESTTPGETPTPPTVGGTVGGIPLSTIALVGGGAFFILILAIVLGGRKR